MRAKHAVACPGHSSRSSGPPSPRCRHPHSPAACGGALPCPLPRAAPYPALTPGPRAPRSRAGTRTAPRGRAWRPPRQPPANPPGLCPSRPRSASARRPAAPQPHAQPPGGCPAGRRAARESGDFSGRLAAAGWPSSAAPPRAPEHEHASAGRLRAKRRARHRAAPHTPTHRSRQRRAVEHGGAGRRAPRAARLQVEALAGPQGLRERARQARARRLPPVHAQLAHLARRARRVPVSPGH